MLSVSALVLLRRQLARPLAHLSGQICPLHIFIDFRRQTSAMATITSYCKELKLPPESAHYHAAA